MYGSFETLLRGLYVRTIRKQFSPLNLQRLKLLYFGWDYRKLFSLPSLSLTDQLRLVRDFLMIDWHVPAGCVPREVVAIAMGVAEVRERRASISSNAVCSAGISHAS